MKFVVRLFPEITIKSPPVRKRLTKLLTESLRVLLKRVHSGCKVERDWDKIDIEVNNDNPELASQIIDILGCTPGIAHFFQVKRHAFKSLDDLYQLAQATWGGQLAGRTFCVRVKRSGKHDFTSTDAERYIGGGLNQHNPSAGVRMKNPDMTLNLEIKGDYVDIVEQRFPGLGGFPVGTQEDVLSLISGGFDSTVASFLTQKRGLKTHFCFFNLGGDEHETAVKEVAFYLWNRFASSHRVKFITVPFEPVVAEILQKVQPANMGVVLKRMMIRAAQRIAERGKIDALVTGEAVAQVSSQTLPNLAVIDEVSEMLVLRPLVTMDKRDIISLSRVIGAEEFSAAIPEYCGVISVKPSARVKAGEVREQEAQMDPAALEQALEGVMVQSIDEVMEDRRRERASPRVYADVVAGQILIDIRHQNERELRRFNAPPETEVVAIPFYKLSSEFVKLDPSREYLLYCDKGVMSKLHAAHLLDAGNSNVAVYRP